jgi:hypothetical protein
MSLDVVDLRSFYVHPLGKVARRFVGVGIRRLWTGSKGLRVLGIGYSTPISACSARTPSAASPSCRRPRGW